MLPATATRVPEHTSESVNEQVRRRTRANVERYAAAGPAAIERRLAELDHEWDIERTLQTNFAAVALLGVALGEMVDRRWHLFSAVASCFMVQHALQGWCPPVPVFRRLGFRTAKEIDEERCALKARRGDFDNVAWQGDGGDRARIGRILHAVER